MRIETVMDNDEMWTPQSAASLVGQSFEFGDAQGIVVAARCDDGRLVMTLDLPDTPELRQSPLHVSLDTP